MLFYRRMPDYGLDFKKSNTLLTPSWQWTCKVSHKATTNLEIPDGTCPAV